VSIFINACDILYGVVGSDSPSNPIKCYEYFAGERPLITSQAPELSFVSEYDLGYVLNSVTPENIAKAIRDFHCKGEDSRTVMGKRGRKYIVNNHTWEAVAENIISSKY
jgi:glycosyltransferase involved in cell wall biosynthesis